MKNFQKKHLTLLILLTFLTGGVLWYGGDRFNTTDDIIIPTEFIFQGKTIALAWTDDNMGEDLIIQSDRKEYSGFNEVDVYFSITNTNKEDQNTDIVVWVKDEKVEVKEILKIDGDDVGSIVSLELWNLNAEQSQKHTPSPSQEGNQNYETSDEANSQTISTATHPNLSQEGNQDYGANDMRKNIKGFTNGYAVNDQIKTKQTNFYKAKIKYPPMSDGEFFIEAFGVGVGSIVPLGLWNINAEQSQTGSTASSRYRSTLDYGANISAYGHLDPWYSSSWSYRRQIIIDHSEVADVAVPSTTYEDFPVYVHITGLSNVETDGADIRFTNLAGTELPREIEKYDSGTLDVWVKFTLTKDAGDTSDDVIYMYYGNSSATEPAANSTYGSDNVWNSNYKMVQHMQEDPTDTSPAFVDSTLNNNDGTDYGDMTTTDQVAGRLDGSLDFDGGDDYVLASPPVVLKPITLSCWFRVSNTTDDHVLISISDEAGSNDWFRMFASGNTQANKLVANIKHDADVTAISTNAFSADIWHYGVAVYEASRTLVYLDNVETIINYTKTPVDLDNCTIGVLKYNLFARYTTGLIDEVRISNTVRTADWIKTEYNNQNAPSTFLTINAEEDNTPTEFISKIRSSGGNYTLLSTWEDEVECDLTATTTRVFSGALTLGALAENDLVELYRGGVDQGIDAYVVATATGGQILVDGITGISYDLIAQTGDVWQKDASNYWTISGTTGNELGDTAIAVAECYNDWPSGLDDTVVITGWTTNADNYVKITAPANERHNGTEHSGFYLKPTSVATMISIQERYTRVEFLELDGSSTGSGGSGIWVGSWDGGNVPGSYSRVYNCLIHDYYHIGIGIGDYNPAYIYNNIIYNTRNNNYGAIRPTSGASGLYVYNNAIYNCCRGIYEFSGMYIKNNVSIGNSNGDFYSVSSPIEESNNISSDSTAPGTGSLTNQTLSDIAFVSIVSGSEDLHIQSTSVAKDAGTDLSSTFTTDIDNQTRSGAWDIGADEFDEITHLIRKTYTVGAISGNINRLSNVVTVNLTSAHDNLKVGQTIKIWDVDDSSFDGYFTIASVASTTQFTYAQSGSDANSANGSVGGDYELLSTWEADQQKDLVAAEQIEVAECYNDWKTGLEDNVTISGWTTDVDNYVKVYAPVGERHDGTPEDGSNYTGFAIKQTTINYIPTINVSEYYVRIEDLILVNWRWTDVTHPTVIYAQNSGERGLLKNCIGISNGDGSRNVFTLASHCKAINSIAIGGGSTVGFSTISYPDNVKIYNCTATNCSTGYGGNTRYSSGGSDITIKNSLSTNCTTGFSSGPLYVSEYFLYNCASEDGTADDFGGTGNRVNQTFTFVDEANDDFHLASTDLGAKNQGIDLSADADYPFSTDIDGDTRPYDGVWDIGADEVSGYAVTQINTTHTNKWTDGLVGYWSFDGQDMDWSQSTAEARDTSGNNNHGNVINGASAVSGKVGQGLEFDGVDDYVNVGDIADGLSEVTVCAWVKADVADTVHLNIVYETNSLELYRNQYGENFHFLLLNESTYKVAAGDTYYQDTDWHFVCGTYDDPYIDLYVDGVDNESATVELEGPLRARANDMTISYPTTYTWDGIIDEVRIYNRALSPDEIAEQYRVGAREMQVDAPLVNKLTDGLVGHWTFNGQDMDWGSSSAEAIDRSGQANHGDVIGATAVSGISGQGMSFDGVDDYVDAGSNISLDDLHTKGGMSISAWINPHTAGEGEYGRIADKDSNFAGAWYFSLHGNTGRQLQFVKDGSTDLYVRSNTNVITFNQWQHVVVAWDGSVTATNVHLYVNGVETGYSAQTDGVSLGSEADRNFRIGSRFGGGFAFNGLIDEVRIYNRALLEDEIGQLYRIGASEIGL